jgi:hypothetical protein
MILAMYSCETLYLHSYIAVVKCLQTLVGARGHQTVVGWPALPSGAVHKALHRTQVVLLHARAATLQQACLLQLGATTGHT